MKSVLQDWVMELPLRAQGTLLTGVRGCDLAPKPPTQKPQDIKGRTITMMEPAERQLVAFLRYCILNPADEREIGVAGAFFQAYPPTNWKPSQFGHYPQHWYSHLMHCFEVVGYCHPHDPPEQARTKIAARDIYYRLVSNLHLRPETSEQMFARLTEDRIATNTVVS